MSEHEPGCYVTRDGDGRCRIEDHDDGLWYEIGDSDGQLFPRGEPVARCADEKALCEAALLGLAHTPREGETCRDCRGFSPGQPNPTGDYGFDSDICTVRNETTNDWSKPCARFSRREQG